MDAGWHRRRRCAFLLYRTISGFSVCNFAVIQTKTYFTTMEKTSRKENTSLLISKKAYKDFISRIRQVLGAIALPPESISEAINLLDKYVKGEISDLYSTDTMVKLTLMMLKSEIDKAMRRSTAARERAKLRREKAAPTSETNENVFRSEDSDNFEKTENSKLTERPMNRRARREYEHELAREQRRRERHLKRMKG